jgi:hypothetical protein
LQDLDAYADGIQYICEAHHRVAKQYLADGSYQLACPPLQALLSIMAEGNWNGFEVTSPEVRQMFTREYLLASDWYRTRLVQKQQSDIRLWNRKIEGLQACIADPVRQDWPAI